MSRIGRWIIGIVGVIVLLLLGVIVVAAVAPQKADPAIDMAAHGAGSSSVEPSYSGLQREFPPLNEPADNPTTPEKAELGRLLFFDPVLSANNDFSCASCHHPDLGFSDGRATAAGANGIELTRNTMSLWNVAYAPRLFWDGRVATLEEQAAVPLTHPDEMGVGDTAEMVTELAAIPDYVERFGAAFGDGAEAVSADNVNRALAAFQRTLISNDSPFDRYAAGEFDALTAQQRRGLALFRSGATRCFECHTAPTFASDTFRVIGVPSDDPGRSAVAGDAREGAFRVPSLRNIALSAPYMHDGSLATLEEVVDFYARGGGRDEGMENVDVFVSGFELTEQERADLVSFLYALTDESQLSEIPAAVPSGLPIVASVANPQRDVAAEHNAGTSNDETAASREPMVITVQEGETIQAAVDRAQPGDVIDVPYGVYHERVVIDMSDITLRGIPNEAGEFPILDGEGVLSEGVIASGNNFTVGYLHTRNYTDNGVLVEGVTGVHFHDIFAENVGTYGVYPVQSTNVLVERVTVTGVDDAGIYAGQCENVVIRDSTVYGNVIGIEVENTLGGEVYNNHAYDNSLGVLVILLPQLTSKISSGTLVYDNLIEANNHPNFAPEGSTARIAPPGTGILLVASDDNRVYNNEIRDNKTAGLALFSLTGTGAFDADEIDVGPLPERNHTYNNTFANNGYDPDPVVAELGIPAGDILWDGSGAGNRFDEPGASGGFPPILPGSGWPGFLQRAYGNVLNFVIGLVA